MTTQVLSRFCFAILITIIICGSAMAQDNVRGSKEPIVSTIDPSKLTYDILVDGNLQRDDPANHQFKTVQAAYAAAQPGTEEKRTVIGIKPNVYMLPATETRTPSLRITKNYITFLGLTNNRRSVVLADNRGLQQGAEDNGYILDVDAVGFSMKNLTVINFCNTDYEYPGDSSKNLKKRSDVITQAVALQASGDKHLYENVALLSRSIRCSSAPRDRTSGMCTSRGPMTGWAAGKSACGKIPRWFTPWAAE